MPSFKDKRILITGAGRGIGKRLALGFAAAGARVGLLARSKAELDLADLEIQHAGGISLRLRADVRDYEQVSAAVERMTAQYGGVDVLICAAATLGPIGLTSETAAAEWADAVTTNLLGAMHAARAVLPGMQEQRAGKIIFISGTGAEGPRPRFSAYSASKAGLVRFAESLAEEVREFNIQVNSLNPGRTYTAMTDEILRAGEQAGEQELLEAQETRSKGGVAPERQLMLAQFLASERSNHVSGKLVSVSDDWRRLEHHNAHGDHFTLRRHARH